MRAKKIIRESQEFKDALREVKKEDDGRAIYARVPFSLYIKLINEIAKKRISMAEWIRQKIDEI